MNTLGLTFLVLLTACDGGVMTRNTEPRETEALRSENPNERETARRAVMARRAELISSLEGTIRDLAATERRGTVTTAMQLLGALRSVESVPLLAQNIAFQFFYKETKRPQLFEDQHPAAGALIEIGLPSVGPVLDQARNSDDERIHRIAAVVVCQIQGRKWATTAIDERIERETNARSKQRLS